jgi:hypothetical protein
MLHFCRIEDITAGLTVAPRFHNDLRGIRDAVTAKINSFIRRNLEFQADVIEYFDVPDLPSGQSINLWLEKKAIVVPSVQLGYSTRAAWDDNPVDEGRIILHPELGKLTVYGYFRGWQRGLRVVYDGGFPPRQDDEEVMACPEGLKYAAAQQCIYEARRALSGDQGTATDDDKKTPVKMMADLLYDTAVAFLDYRRPLGR